MGPVFGGVLFSLVSKSLPFVLLAVLTLFDGGALVRVHTRGSLAGASPRCALVCVSCAQDCSSWR